MELTLEKEKKPKSWVRVSWVPSDSLLCIFYTWISNSEGMLWDCEIPWLLLELAATIHLPFYLLCDESLRFYQWMSDSCSEWSAFGKMNSMLMPLSLRSVKKSRYMFVGMFYSSHKVLTASLSKVTLTFIRPKPCLILFARIIPIPIPYFKLIEKIWFLTTILLGGFLFFYWQLSPLAFMYNCIIMLLMYIYTSLQKQFL